MPDGNDIVCSRRHLGRARPAAFGPAPHDRPRVVRRIRSPASRGPGLLQVREPLAPCCHRHRRGARWVRRSSQRPDRRQIQRLVERRAPRPSRRCSRNRQQAGGRALRALIGSPRCCCRLGRLRPAPGRHEHHLGGATEAGEGHPTEYSRTAFFILHHGPGTGGLLLTSLIHQPAVAALRLRGRPDAAIKPLLAVGAARLRRRRDAALRPDHKVCRSEDRLARRRVGAGLTTALFLAGKD